jgi:hypothetical protein
MNIEKTRSSPWPAEGEFSPFSIGKIEPPIA